MSETRSVLGVTCRRLGCTIRMTHDVVAMRHIFQHGDNPEHVLLINERGLMALSRPPGMTWEAVWYCHVASKVIRWANEIHRYQEAAHPTPHEAAASQAGQDDGREGE